MARLKEELALLRVLLVLALATDIALIGWLAQHYEASERALLNAALFAIVIVLAVIAGVSWAIFTRLNKLED